MTAQPQIEIEPSTIALAAIPTELPQAEKSPSPSSPLANTVPSRIPFLITTNPATPAPTTVAEPSPTVRSEPTSTLTPSVTPSPTVTPTPTAIPTPDPYAGLTIADLRERDYGGGELKIEQRLATYTAFTRYLVSYPSDDLTIYGFMNLPTGEPPFPVMIVIHGYVDPARYQTLAYTTRYADALARAGYLVIHPNLRGYPPSGDGPNRFRVGMAVDVLNLIALVEEWGDREGILEVADTERIGLMGHSMGGSIAIRVLAIDPSVDAVVLYGSMSGDERENYERMVFWRGGEAGQRQLDVAQEDLERISPIYHLDQIEAAVSIHHGGEDEEVPLRWSADLAERLWEMGKTVDGKPPTTPSLHLAVEAV